MSPTTIRSLRSSRRHGFPTLIRMRMSQLTLPIIQREVTARAKTVSPKTIRNNLDLLRPVLAQYRKDIDLDDLKLPKKQRTEIIIPTNDEIQKLLAYVKERNPEMMIPVLLGALLSLRRSEICGLTRADFSTSSAGEYHVHIHAALVRADDGCH